MRPQHKLIDRRKGREERRAGKGGRGEGGRGGGKGAEGAAVRLEVGIANKHVDIYHLTCMLSTQVQTGG